MPASSGHDTVRDWALLHLDEAYERTSWHGPNLKGSLRGVDAVEASWSPASGRKSIAEHVLHAAYWKYTVQRRLTGEKRASFPLSGSNWFQLPQPFDDRAWRECRTLLDRQHFELRSAIEALAAEEFSRPAAGSSRTTVARLVRGVILHDIYHVGQIQLLKRLVRDWADRRK